MSAASKSQRKRKRPSNPGQPSTLSLPPKKTKGNNEKEIARRGRQQEIEHFNEKLQSFRFQKLEIEPKYINICLSTNWNQESFEARQQLFDAISRHLTQKLK